MGYVPTQWRTGDIVTAEKMNKIENGIKNAGSSEMESVTYGELVEKRANGELVPGRQYRITDNVYVSDNPEPEEIVIEDITVFPQCIYKL